MPLHMEGRLSSLDWGQRSMLACSHMQTSSQSTWAPLPYTDNPFTTVELWHLAQVHTDWHIISQSPIHVNTLLKLLVLWYLLLGHLLYRHFCLSHPCEALSPMNVISLLLSLSSKSHSRSLHLTSVQHRLLACSIPTNGFQLIFFTKGKGKY